MQLVKTVTLKTGVVLHHYQTKNKIVVTQNK